MTESGGLGLFRRCIYSRWFYALLAGVCVLNAVAELADILDPGKNVLLDVVSIIASMLAAVLALLILIDLQFRRAKL